MAHRVPRLHVPPHTSFVRTVVVIQALRFAWVVAIVWYELGTFFWSVSGCRWPDKELHSPTSTQEPTHVLLIADPIVLDHRSYPGRASWLQRITQFIVDFNLRKSWNVVTRFRPQELVFLGNMMDNGRSAREDADYERYFSRFQTIFRTDPSVNVHYLPGNRDVGLGNSRVFSPRSRQRYVAHFGPLNQQISVGNHTLALIDAPGLVEEDYQREKAGQDFEDWQAPKKGAVQFIKDFAAAGSDEPVILMSHIPLFRPERASCGPLREKGTIRRGVGYGWQNTLGKKTTQYLLKSIQPVAVYSGDDHDYCEYMHSIPLIEEGPEALIHYVKEVTVKSFSMAGRIQQPGFQLLSLIPRTESSVTPHRTHADTICLLPNQTSIYTHRYIPLLLITFFAILFLNIQQIRSRSGFGMGGVRAFLPRFGGTSGYSTTKKHRNLHARRRSLVWSTASPTALRSRSPHSPIHNNRTLRLPPHGYANGHTTPNHSNAKLNSLTPTYRASPASASASLLSFPNTPLDSPLLLSPALRPSRTMTGTTSASASDIDEDLMDPMYHHSQLASRRATSRLTAPSHSSLEGDTEYEAENEATTPEDEDYEKGVYASGSGSGEQDQDSDETAFLRGAGVGDQEGFKTRRTSLSGSGLGTEMFARLEWSTSFVFRGRRRRIVLSVPTAVAGFLSVLRIGVSAGDARSRGRRARYGLTRLVLMDLWAVTWPPLLVLAGIVWWMFS